ncbi:MAG: PQQ-binding-like beta-propeller repeat protein, partial [Actinomycetota bacterium]|nr:PQQ-binding-like beta-propeller repeat protein [Actinomycetota bacterium]
AHDAAVAADGSRLYLTGETRATLDGQLDLFVLALDAATGTVVWHVALDRSRGNDYGVWIDVGPGDDMVYTVASSTGSTGVDAWVVALAADDGDVAWTERFDGGRSGNDYAAGASLSPDGGDLHVAGAAYGPMGADLFAVSYQLGPGRGDGPSWTAVHDLTGFGGADQATTVAVAPDGGILAFGYVEVGEADPVGARSIDVAAVRFDAGTGEMLWRANVPAPAGAGRSLAVPLASSVAPDGRTAVVAGGSAMGTALTDFGMHMAGLDPRDGSLRWSAHHQPPGSQFGYASDVAFSRDGMRTYVAGNVWFGVFASKGDLTTLALDTETGTQQWAGRLLYRDGDPRDFFPYPAYAAVLPDSGRVVAATTYVGNRFSEDRANYADVLVAAYDD